MGGAREAESHGEHTIATDAANKIPTTVLPATLVGVPATVTYELKKYSCLVNGGREGDVESLELHNSKMVAMATNRGNGGMSEIEIWSRGEDEMFAREQGPARLDRRLRQGRAHPPSGGFQWPARDDRGRVRRGGGGGQHPSLRGSRGQGSLRQAHPELRRLHKAKTGEYFSLKGGSKLTPAQVQDFLGQYPGVVVWSKTEQKWTGKVA